MRLKNSRYYALSAHKKKIKKGETGLTKNFKDIYLKENIMHKYL